MKTIYLTMILFMVSFNSNAEDTSIYTLYHDDPYIEKLCREKPGNYSSEFCANTKRVHVATFDRSTRDYTYNKFMCNRVKGFFEEKLKPNKPHNSNFWCERGRFKG